jgi:signal transduction histidine kinase
MVLGYLDEFLASRVERSAASAAAAIWADAEVLQSHLEVVLDERLGPLTADQKRFLDVVARHAQRIAKLADDLELVALVKLGEVEVEWAWCDLAQLVAEARDHAWPIAHLEAKPIELHSADHIWVIADEQHLGRALHELVGFAVDAASSASSVELLVQKDRVEISYESESAPEQTGPSLAVAESLVTALGGTLTIERVDERVRLSAILPAR